jgi:hypothetical protein
MVISFDRSDPVEALGLASVDLAEVDGARPMLDVPGPLPVALKLMNAATTLSAPIRRRCGAVHAVLGETTTVSGRQRAMTSRPPVSCDFTARRPA